MDTESSLLCERRKNFQALKAKVKIQGHLQRAKNRPSCPAKRRGVGFFFVLCLSTTVYALEHEDDTVTL